MRVSVLAPIALVLVSAACQADREAAEDVPLDAPPAVEQAPATPFPPQPIGGATQVDSPMASPAGDTAMIEPTTP